MERKTEKNGMKRRSGIAIIGKLIGLVKPLLPVMLLAILLGTIGHLCAIFLTITAGYGILSALGEIEALSAGRIFIALVVMAVARGLLHYGEQYCNHFIAFRLLAIIRHKVFAKLRVLCPAKLEGKDRGNLISIITSDIELLEVFYAHTISPVAIATLVSIVMLIFIGMHSVYAMFLALAAYIVVGIIIPLVMGKAGGDRGMEFRTSFGDLNSYVLDSLKGLDETIQYGTGEERRAETIRRSEELAGLQRPLNRLEQTQKSVTDVAVLGASFGMLFLMVVLFMQGRVETADMLLCIIAMMSSFGPVIALSNLANNLNQTLASGERVLSLLEEEAEVEEVSEGIKDDFEGVASEQVDFVYDEEAILNNYSLDVKKGSITGLFGASGSGKSTLLKLLMRFWDVTGGRIKVSGKDIREFNTGKLRDMESYMIQETYIFHDSIYDNIAVGKPGATREEVVEAAKKASIHDFIMTLPDGYDTICGEAGDTLSGGERQRIGLARAFLHNAPLMLLDEPTSNLDPLNEGIILKSIADYRGDRTVVLVSHRKSTLAIADKVTEMKATRSS